MKTFRYVVELINGQAVMAERGIRAKDKGHALLEAWIRMDREDLPFITRIEVIEVEQEEHRDS